MLRIQFLLVAVALVGQSYANVDTRNEKLYYAPTTGTSGIAILTPFCLLTGLLCPAGYTGGIGGGGSGGGSVGAPANAAQQRTDALTNGNNYRTTHGANPLTTNAQLQAEAQAYAEQLASTGTFAHATQNPPGQFGENLAKLPPGGTIAQANTAWYGERANYCPAAGPLTVANIGAVGHFTQMVWKSSTQVGYGVATGRDGSVYVVARYTPPGNIQGQETANLQC